MKKLMHFAAGYLAVSGLGVMFSCLILGATQYLMPLAVFMVCCAVVSVASNPDKTRG